MKHHLQLIASLAFILIVATYSVYGQANQPSPAPNGVPDRFNADPVRQLNLTPEQREQIRAIRERSKEERAAINQQVRDHSRALEEALDSDVPDEALVQERVEQLAAAQAAAMRMRILTEVKIRQVLTQEQRILLKTLRHSAREFRREQRLHAPEGRRHRRERSLRLRERRNNMRPLSPNQDPQPTPRP